MSARKNSKKRAAKARAARRNQPPVAGPSDDVTPTPELADTPEIAEQVPEIVDAEQDEVPEVVDADEVPEVVDAEQDEVPEVVDDDEVPEAADEVADETAERQDGEDVDDDVAGGVDAGPEVVEDEVEEPDPTTGDEPATEPQAQVEPEPQSEPEPQAAEPSAASVEVVDGDEQTAGAPGTPAATSRRAWRRLGRAAAPRPTKANVLATVLAVGLGFAIAAQVRQTSLEGLEDLREDELIRILDTVDQDGSRLAEEIQTLRLSRDRLKSDTTSLAESRKAAQQRLDSLAILAGTVPAKGPGIVLTIRDPEFGVTAPMLLDTLQELRDAGAEAVEINDIRIVANTYFTDGEGGIAISGVDVSAPYVVTAIGDGSTLASAMEIPGGVTNTVRTVGGEAVVEVKDQVTVTALRSVSEPQYARPVPSPTTS